MIYSNYLNRLGAIKTYLKENNMTDELEIASEIIRDQNATMSFFDFDNTLFRSPMKPALWKGSWWASPLSLSPPIVPEIPDESWWIQETVSAAKAAIADPNTFSVCLTGRQDHVYRGRIPYLLHDAGLNFDMVKLSNGNDTFEFKSREILELIRKHPFVSKIGLWDDKATFLTGYKALIESDDPEIEVTIHHVVAESKAALGGDKLPEIPAVFPNKASYIGLMLDSGSKGKLFGKFPAKHKEESGDHVTVIFNPNGQNLEAMRDLFGKKYDINVTGYAEDEKGQAIVVNAPGIAFPEGKIPHITISTAEGASPVYSNEMLAKSKITPVQNVTLSGILWWK